MSENKSTMMKKQLLFCIFFLTFLYAQTEPVYNFFYKNLSLVSPSFAGQMNSMDFFTVYRKNWAGFPDSPQSVSVLTNFNLATFDARVPFGLGLHYHFDEIGGLRQNNLTIPLSYHFSFIPKTAGKLLLGVGFRFQHSDLRNVWFYEHGSDPHIPQNNLQGFLPFNFDTGLSYIYKDAYLFSFAVENVLSTQNQIRQEILTIFDILQRQYVLYAGQILSMDKKNQLDSNHLIRLHNMVKFNSLQFDWNFSADYLIQRLIFVGLSYRYSGTTGLKLGMEKDFLVQKTIFNWSLGYSLEYAWNQLKNTSFSHEIFTSFHIFLVYKKAKIKTDEQNVNNSRYYQNN